MVENRKPEALEVSLGQKFKPFPDGYNGLNPWEDVEKYYKSVWWAGTTAHPFCWPGQGVLLNLSLGNDLPLEMADSLNSPGHLLRVFIGLFPWSQRQSGAFSPFNPSVRYVVDGKDFTTETRERKIKALEREAQRMKLKDKITVRHLYIYMIPENGTERIMFLPLTVETYLHRLRCQVFAAGQNFESRAVDGQFGVGSLFFHSFYPFDTGPLAEAYGELKLRGEDIALPEYSGSKDSEKLASVEMEFRLGGVQR